MMTGLKFIRKDHRDYSFPRTFGSTTAFTSCNFDAGFPILNQNTDGLPEGCTGYCQTSICQDEDKKQYLPRFTYDQTLMEEGIMPSNAQFEQVGCNIRDSLASTIVYGLQALGETPAQALNHRRGQYFALEQTQGLDWFDTLRSTLQLNQRSISVGTPWYEEFESPQNGIIKPPVSYLESAPMHNHKICGWKTINGVDYLIDASWQGTEYGDSGFCYFSREIINSLMTQPGTGAFTLTPFTAANIQNVELTVYEYLLSYLRMILKLS